MSEPVRKTILVRCPPDHAFRVFVEQVDQWWPQSHRGLRGSRLVLEPGVGGRLVERTADAERELGRIVAWEPPRALAFAWRLGAPSTPTLATITFTAEGPDTRVDVVHTDATPPLPDWPKTSAIYDRSWGHVLEALRAHLSGSTP